MRLADIFIRQCDGRVKSRSDVWVQCEIKWRERYYNTKSVILFKDIKHAFKSLANGWKEQSGAVKKPRITVPELVVDSGKVRDLLKRDILCQT